MALGSLSSGVWLTSVLQLIKSEVEKEQIEAGIRAEVQEEMQQLIEQAVAKESTKAKKTEQAAATWKQEVSAGQAGLCAVCASVQLNRWL